MDNGNYTLVRDIFTLKYALDRNAVEFHNMNCAKCPNMTANQAMHHLYCELAGAWDKLIL